MTLRHHLSDMVTCSAYAASMGGSQIWLEEGETCRWTDMLKAICVVSANDCCAAMGGIPGGIGGILLWRV